MSRRVLFVDRDGTLIEEPDDHQVDALDKLRFMPGVFAALTQLSGAGFVLAMITNQDGLGSASFPQRDFDAAHNFMLAAFASQGIHFDAVFICPHRAQEDCACRKPRTALVDDYLKDIDRRGSAMVGDRDTDLEFANAIGVRGLRISSAGPPGERWPAITQELLARRARIERVTRETQIEVSVNLDGAEPLAITTGIGFFDHMLEQLAKHGGFSLQMRCKGDLVIDEHHTVEDCALALGEALRQALGSKAGIARFGFVVPMDEAQAQVALDLSGRAFCVFEGRFGREVVGQLPTELVPHFFRSLADALAAALHIQVRGENAHHMIEACFKAVGRALRQALHREGTELPTTKGVL